VRLLCKDSPFGVSFASPWLRSQINPPH